jgi:hypothetical protein
MKRVVLTKATVRVVFDDICCCDSTRNATDMKFRPDLHKQRAAALSGIRYR